MGGEGGGGAYDPIFLHGSSSWVELRLQTKNQLPGCPGTGLKVCLVGGGWITDQKPCHSNLNGVGLSWAVTTISRMLEMSSAGTESVQHSTF